LLEISIVLAAVAGYVDTLGFIALAGLFTAHVTGNFVLIGKELSDAGGGSGGVLLKLLAFPAFILGVVIARLLVLRAQAKTRSTARPLLVLQALLLLGFMAAGIVASPITQTDTPLAMVAGLLGAVAMGLQNAQGRLELSTLTPTTVMTGNVTQIVIDIVDLLLGHDAENAASARTRLRKMTPAVAGFAIGAISGAFAFHFIAFWALLVPVALLFIVALRFQGNAHGS